MVLEEVGTYLDAICLTLFSDFLTCLNTEVYRRVGKITTGGAIILKILRNS
jgi:hypothetical protein